MKNRPVLSICIPTFNRKDVVLTTVRNILQSDDQRFDINIVDNCSTDSIKQELQSINDIRLHYFCNSKNIGGILNPVLAPLKGSGKYSMLLLDKDTIEYKGLSGFIDVLEKEELSHGFCELNINDRITSEVYFYKPGYDSIVNTAYLSKHPSGMFWRTDELLTCQVIKSLEKHYEVFGFYFELINAELSATSKLNSCFYVDKLVFTEQLEQCGKIKTKSYSKNNVFFLPKMRKHEYQIYLKHLEKLEIQKMDKELICKVLVKKCIRSILDSWFLRYNHNILKHYSISKADIKLGSVFINIIVFLSWFIIVYNGTINKRKIIYDICKDQMR